MTQPIAATNRLKIDRSFVERLLLGALSEHEQRLIAIRLLRQDESFRKETAIFLESFKSFDLDLAAHYNRLLQIAGRQSAFHPGELERRRRELLSLASERIDLEQAYRGFVRSDVLKLGEIVRGFFSWSMSEILLERSRRVELNTYEATPHLFLALLVIDVVELLGAAGRSSEFPEVVRDVRRRVQAGLEFHSSRQSDEHKE